MSVVVGEVLKFGFDLVDVFSPVLDSLEANTGASSQGFLGCSATNLLKGPGHILVEVGHTETQGWVGIHHVVAELDVGVGHHLLVGCSDVTVETMDVPVFQPVLQGVLAYGGFGIDSIIEADINVQNDFLLEIDFSDALLDSSVDVDVPDSAAIHVRGAVPLLGRENAWDGS